VTRETANEVWGPDAVARALAEPTPDPITDELVRAIKGRTDPPGAFREWALAQPWPRFCAIVRIVSGAVREEVMAHAPEPSEPSIARTEPPARGAAKGAKRR
jgi:hypothetical protein